MSVITCCKDCTKPRFVDGVRCHSFCEDYDRETSKNKKSLEQLYKDNEYSAFRSSNITKTMRRIRNSQRK